MRVGAASLAVVALACASVPGATPAAQPAAASRHPIRIVPGTTRYRSVSYTHVEREVSGQPQHSHEVRVFFLTASLASQGANLHVTFTVDSVARYDMGPAPSGIERMRAVTFTGTLGPDGEIHDLAGGDSTNHAVAELADGLSHLYPRIPSRGLEPGAQWTDTTQTTSRTGAFPLTVVAVSQHWADPPTGAGPEGAIPIRTVTSYTFSGQGSQGGQAFSVKGEGRRYTVELLGLAGVFQRMVSADTSSFTVTLPALDLTIPGRQTRADTLSLLPE